MSIEVDADVLRRPDSAPCAPACETAMHCPGLCLRMLWEGTYEVGASGAQSGGEFVKISNPHGPQVDIDPFTCQFTNRRCAEVLPGSRDAECPSTPEWLATAQALIGGGRPGWRLYQAGYAEWIQKRLWTNVLLRIKDGLQRLKRVALNRHMPMWVHVALENYHPAPFVSNGDKCGYRQMT